MNPLPLVSIVMPALNAQCWIREALESCLGQTWPNLEIIVIDNGSLDQTVDIALSFRSPRVHVLKCARTGASAARNEGIAASRGDYIQFLDADDVLAPDKILRQINLLACSPDCSIASGPWSRFVTHPGEQALMPEPVWRNCLPEEFLIKSWMGGGMMPIFGWLTPKHLIEAAGPWNEELSVNDDGEFFARVVLASAKIVFCADATGYYRTVESASVSKGRGREAMVSALRAIDLSCSHLLGRVASSDARLACATQYQRFSYSCFPAHHDLVRISEQRAHALGGSTLECPGGAAFKVASALLGWKTARRMQVFTRP